MKKRMSKIHRFGIVRENVTKLYKAVKLTRRIRNVLYTSGYDQNTFTCKSKYFFSFIIEDDEVNVLQKLPLGIPQYVPAMEVYTPQFLEASKPYRHSFEIPNILRNSYLVNTIPNGITIYENELALIANHTYVTHAIKNVINNRRKFNAVEMKYMNKVHWKLKAL